jgi:hypothetical protein
VIEQQIALTMSYFENGISLYPNYMDDNNNNFVKNMNNYLLLEDNLNKATNEKKIKTLWSNILKVCIKHNIFIKSTEQLKRDIVYYVYIKDQEHTR